VIILEELIDEMIIGKIRSLMVKFPEIIGYDRKLRNGKIRVYTSKSEIQNITVKSIKVKGKEIPIEFFYIGKVKALGD
jgi:hypothetical protein